MPWTTWKINEKKNTRDTNQKERIDKIILVQTKKYNVCTPEKMPMLFRCIVRWRVGVFFKRAQLTLSPSLCIYGNRCVLSHLFHNTIEWSTSILSFLCTLLYDYTNILWFYIVVHAFRIDPFIEPANGKWIDFYVFTFLQSIDTTKFSNHIKHPSNIQKIRSNLQQMEKNRHFSKSSFCKNGQSLCLA